MKEDFEILATEDTKYHSLKDTEFHYVLKSSK